jgi:D-glycero-D-manno-heptose 1,7-bisphosphate phosphatase
VPKKCAPRRNKRATSPPKSNRELRPAVFLDRDGTIVEEKGYANHISRLEIFPYAARSICRLNRAGLPVIVVTNQSGIARDFFPESLVIQIHKKLKRDLASAGARIDDFYFCPHIRDDRCDCRKPLPGMLKKAAQQHHLDLTRSVVVSDRFDDIHMGHQVGCYTILVLTGYGAGEHQWHRKKWGRQPDHVVKNLEEAVKMILKHQQKGTAPKGNKKEPN